MKKTKKTKKNTFRCICGTKKLTPTKKSGIVPVHKTPKNHRCEHIWQDVLTKKERKKRRKEKQK